MQKLTETEIINLIENEQLFECESNDGSFFLKVDEYTPALCTAIHDGHRFNTAIEAFCSLTEAERLYEEDPFTGELIDSMPITLIGRDSRYEYDLNRPIARCIYTTAWGKQVWTKKLPLPLRRQSIEKHRIFYRVLDALIAKIEEKFRACIVFDVHSFNAGRIEIDTPTFNLGTEQVDLDRWHRVVSKFQSSLGSMALSHTQVRVAQNEVFYGRGYLISHVNSRFENTLVLPCEVKKYFMNEASGEVYPLLLNELKRGIKHSITDTGAFFARMHSKKTRTTRLDMLSTQLDPAITKVDRSLYLLAKGMETLHYINPINITQEKRKFLSKNGNYQPDFHYRPLAIDPYAFREKLYRLPVEKIHDSGIEQVYCHVIDGLSSKIDLLVNAGRPQFVYSSLQYYGEPSLEDEANARFLLHAARFEPSFEKNFSAEQAVDFFRMKASEWGMKCKVELSGKLVASAMVSNSKRTLYINKGATFSQIELNALANHELGVHMATTLNAAIQPLKIFSLGLPGNTMTQEGLAILNEYQNGDLFLGRLQGLALRVLAVREMLKYGDFKHTYSFLYEEMNMSVNEAFKLAVRVHRSGGFTKDYLYLRGVSEALRLQKRCDISNLYVGKTGFDYLPIIDELIERNILKKPQFVPRALTDPEPVPDILSYLVSSIRPTAPIGMVSTSGSELYASA